MVFGMTYSEKLRDSRWQKKRLEVLQREDFKCQWCKMIHGVDLDQNQEVQVHHGYYEKGLDPWEYDSDSLFCLCKEHHKKAQYLLTAAKRAIGRMHPALVMPLVDIACFLMKYGNEGKEPDDEISDDFIVAYHTAKKVVGHYKAKIDDETLNKIWKP